MKRKKLPAEQAIGAHTSAGRPQWRATAAAIAAAVLFGAWASDASALALGRITVRSALGEPLNAEIDLPEITPDEVSSLKTHVAAPDAHDRSRGLRTAIGRHDRLGERAEAFFVERDARAREAFF